MARDPHLDPLRSPSEAGQHPHLTNREKSLRNPQHMYESRQHMGNRYAYRQLPAHQQQQVPPQQHGGVGFWETVAIVGLGGLALWALLDRDRPASSGGTQATPTPSAPPVVVMPPAISLPEPRANPPLLGEPTGVESKPKPKRIRVTTQARDKSGQYKKAGTAKKCRVEGKTS